MSKEICQRCGERDEDLRNLWMACLYAMYELDLPFKRLAIKGRLLEHKGENPIEGFAPLTTSIWSEPIDDEEDTRPFYTLRVCKDCRADWMRAIKDWFNTKPEKESCGSGIFVRRNGATVEITEEEWNELNPGVEPVRVKES